MSTRLTVRQVPPTFTMGGSAGQFDLIMAIINKTPVNYPDPVNTAILAITTGVPSSG